MESASIVWLQIEQIKNYKAGLIFLVQASYEDTNFSTCTVDVDKIIENRCFNLMFRFP